MQKSLKILSVNGSVNEKSLSWMANNYVTQQLAKNHPNSQISLMDLNDNSHFLKSLNVKNFKSFFNDGNSDELIEKLKETDLLVLSTPMINFSYSGLIKNFIDSICVANKTFSYKYSTKGGSIGLLNNLSVIIIATQGAPEGWYAFGNPINLLTETFKFLGVKQIHSHLIPGTKVDPYKSLTYEQILDENKKELDHLVRIFD